MIPTRSASTSASSRYCVVRKTVTPSSLAQPPHLLPQRGPALDVEPGGRLVEEEDARAVDERQREVEPALHPAGIAAHLAIGRVDEADAGEQLDGPWRALGARQRLEARLEAQVLAAREQRIERGLLQRRADRLPHLGPCSRRRSRRRVRIPDVAAAAWRASEPWSTCLRHSGRGSRRSRPGTIARSMPSTARGPFLNSRTRLSASMARRLLTAGQST